MSREWSAEQLAIFGWFKSGSGNLVVRARAGTGKCLGAGTPVLMYDGAIVQVETIKTGDVLMGPGSSPRRVLSTNTGRGPLRRIVPTKGDPWICNDVHVITLAGTNRHMGETIDAPLNALPDNWERNWKLWRTGADWAHRETPIDPYLLGLWIGDGTCGEPQITNSDPEVMAFCKKVAPRYGAELVTRRDDKNNTFNLRFRVGERGEAGRHTPSTLRRFFSSCSVDGKKRPPEVFFVNDRHVRQLTLAGIIDTDGHESCGGFEVVTVDPWLRDRYLFLARSLGFAAYSSEKFARIKEIGFTGTYWRVFISGDLSTLPLRVHRPRERQQIKRVNVTGFRVEDIGDGEYFGFTLDGDGRFLLGDFTVTHNTTTLLEAVQQAPEENTLVAAFNKRIAKELQDRLSRGAFGSAEAKTLHGVGYSIVQRYWERCNVDQRRGFDLAKRAAGDQAPDEIIGKIQKLAGIAKGCLADYTDELTVIAEIESLAVRFGLEPDDSWQQDGWTTARVVRHAWEAMQLASHRGERPTIDFDDMLFLPLINDWARPRYELVCVDEAQDMNAAQLELARRVCRDNGRIAVIGDDRQAIYGFRGADAGAIDRLKAELNAAELGLTTTYRCGKAIVAYAAKLVPDFTAAAGNSDGIIETLHESELVATAKPGDFVLSRKNAPLVSICLRMLRAGKPARIEGKDVAAGLRSIAKRWKPRSVAELMDRIGAWRDREIAKLQAKKTAAADERIEVVSDQAEILLALCDGIATPAELLTRLDSLFGDSEDDRRPAVVCSSIHKAKGLEADRVFVLRNTLYPNRFPRRGRTPKDVDEAEAARNALEEQNLEYVAVTRCRNVLVWVV